MKKKKKCFCVPCALFHRSRGQASSVGQLITKPMTNWTRASTTLKENAVSKTHRDSVRFTRRADRRLPPGCYGNLIVNLTSNVVNRGQNVPVGSTPTDTIGPRSRSRLSPRYVLVVLKIVKINDERIVVLLKRVGSFLSISYKVTHFYASQPTSTLVRRLRVNPTTHDWLRLSWTCSWPSKICPSCESPIRDAAQLQKDDPSVAGTE